MTYIGPSNNTTPQPEPKPATTSNSLPQDQEVEFITRSGRCYGNDETEKKKGKVKIGESPENVEEEAVRVEKEESSEKKEEEELLLQIMKQSEYDIIEQLRKTRAQIFLLSLILSSEVHRHALQKVLY